MFSIKRDAQQKILVFCWYVCVRTSADHHLVVQEVDRTVDPVTRRLVKRSVVRLDAPVNLEVVGMGSLLTHSQGAEDDEIFFHGLAARQALDLDHRRFAGVLIQIRELTDDRLLEVVHVLDAGRNDEIVNHDFPTPGLR